MERSVLEREPGAWKETEPGVLKYQYEQIIKQLLLLQDHAAARTCPYTPTGELCIRKHLMALEAYAEETIPMEDDPAFRERLETLEAEARNHRLDQEAVLCGERAQCLEGLEHWTRQWRKQLELRALMCRAQRPAEERPAPGEEMVPQPATP